MAGDLPFMKLWVDDLLADLQELALSDEEFGAYMRLLLISWKRGSVPANPEARARFVTASAKRFKEELWPAFAEKWESDGNGGLTNPRQEKERKQALGTSASATKAAEARWQKQREREEAEAA